MTYAWSWSWMHPREFVSWLGPICLRSSHAVDLDWLLPPPVRLNTKTYEWLTANRFHCHVTLSLEFLPFWLLISTISGTSVQGRLILTLSDLWETYSIFKQSSKWGLPCVSVVKAKMKGFGKSGRIFRGEVSRRNGVKCKRPMAVLSWLLFNKTELFLCKPFESDITPTLRQDQMWLCHWMMIIIIRHL